MSDSPTFQQGARIALRNTQLRRNLRKATHSVRATMARNVAGAPDWQELRLAAEGIKTHTIHHLDRYLLQLEERVEAAGGQVHWALDAEEANRIVVNLVRGAGAREVIKSKSITSEEIGLNRALGAAGIRPIETDLAELIIQLAEEPSSHILAPAVHKNRAEIRELFQRHLGAENLSDNPQELAEVARRYLRAAFLRTSVGISGANFAVAETGTIVMVESEGNGRMCLTLPRVLITLMGIEKVIPHFRDLEVFMQLLPRLGSSEAMNPYTSLWTGMREGDGPEVFHLVLLDNGRTRVLADDVGRQALRCIRCAACLNVCPVYERVGGHAYGSMYSGPIGAILTPQLRGIENAPTLPYASSLCGACYEVCPVRINIPEVLVHLRGKVVREEQRSIRGRLGGENLSMEGMAYLFADRRRYEIAQRVAQRAARPLERRGTISWLPPPLSGWTAMRDAPGVPRQSFRQWWRTERGGES